MPQQHNIVIQAGHNQRHSSLKFRIQTNGVEEKLRFWPWFESAETCTTKN